MSNSDATKPTPRTDVHTFDFDQDSSKCRRPDGSGWYVQADFARQLERELAEAQEGINSKTHHCPDCGHSCLSDAPKQALTEAQAAIADLNQRLIDRTSGMLDLIQTQQLEIARLKSQARTAREIIEQAYVHNQNMHCFVTKGRLNDQLNEQTHLLRKFLKP